MIQSGLELWIEFQRYWLVMAAAGSEQGGYVEA